jgi:SAM-dependent methyltransferase
MDPTLLATQLRCPSGDDGKEVGRRLAMLNVDVNDWALKLLDIQDNDDVLEIGFGPGAALEQAAKKTVGNVAGMELSQVMVDMAKERNADAVAKGKMDLRQGDSSALPFPDDAFDKVFAVNVLYFWEDPLAQLEEILRVMKDDGVLVLVVLFRPYTAEEEEALAEEAGFTGMSIQRKSLAQSNALALVALK